MIKTYSISDLFITSWLDQLKKPTLTTEQMATVISVRYNLDKAIKENNLTNIGFYAIAMLRLLRKNKSAVAKINEEQVVDCINDITFFREPWYFFPQVAAGIFQAPDEYMHDRYFEQLVYADSAFTKYLKQEEDLKHAHPSQEGSFISEETLNEFVAILYTRPEEFKSKEITDRARLVSQLKDYEKAVIFHTYANVREYIVHRCPSLFPKPDHQAIDTAPVVYTGKMWRTLLFDFSETEAFKGFDRARTAYIYDAMDYLEKKMKESIEQNSKSKAHA